MKKNKFGKLISTFLTMTLAAGSLGVPATALAKSDSSEYVEGEYVIFVETLEEAEYAADAYGMDLDSFAYGVAVLKEKSTLDAVTKSITDLFSTEESEELDFELPELKENIIYRLYDSETYEVMGDEQPDTLPTDNAYHHGLIDTKKAWETSKGYDVTVAIIDTGINASHSEFSGRDFDSAYNSHTDTYGATAVNDIDGHGTHVAGIIGAKETGNDVYGVAPDADLLIIKGSEWTDSDGGYSYFTMASLVRAVDYAVKQGADVINMSLGSTASSSDFKDAIDEAVEAGVTVICAAGNEESSSVSYPASYTSTIAVSGLDADLTFASWYSNYGSKVDISAPGLIASSDIVDSGYSWRAGTSMASPIVAAVAALILEDNDYSPAQVEDILTNTAKEAGEVGKDDYFGNGIVSAYGAVLDTDDMYKVTYNFNDDGVTDDEVSYIVPNGTLIEPDEPTGDTSFLGWATETTSATYYDFTTEITAPIILYAQWDADPVTAPDAPAAPTAKSVTYDSVTLNDIVGAEYGMSTTDTEPGEWQGGTVFSGLSASTTYYFFARIKATSTSAVSASSLSLEVTTSEMDDNDVSMSATYGDTVDMSVCFDGTDYADVGLGTVTYHLDDTTILGEVSNASLLDGIYELTYDTSDKKLSIGENEILVTFTETSGSTDLELATVTLTLGEKDIASTTVTVASQTYTGSALTPTVTVKDGEITLIKDTDYTVEYSNNTDVGTATVTVAGMDYYKNTTTGSFAINEESDDSSGSSSSGSSSSSGGGGGGGGSSSGGINVDTDGTTTTATLKISASTSGKTTTGSVEKDDMDDAIEDALDEVADDGEAVVELDVNTKSYTTKMNFTIAEEALESVANSDIVQLKITSDMGEMHWSKAFVEYLSGLADGEDILVVVELVDSDDVLTDAQKLMMGEIVAYDLSIYIGDTYVDDFDGEVVRMILPFEVADGENADHIVVWHLDDDKDKTVIASTYDSYKEEVGFNAEHFSYYLIGYDEDSVLNEDVEEVEEIVEEDTEEVVEVGENPFTDVSESDFFYNPVLWAVANKITSGTTETTFGSYDTATRGQTVTLIWKAMGSPEPTLEENPFVDIAETDYFYKAVLWAVENKVASGTDVDTFSPNATVTRGQIVTFLWNNAGRPEVDGENPFVDVPSDMYYYNAILWAVKEVITSGTAADTFEPETLCNRGQIVTFLYRNLA